MNLFGKSNINANDGAYLKGIETKTTEQTYSGEALLKDAVLSKSVPQNMGSQSTHPAAMPNVSGNSSTTSLHREVSASTPGTSEGVTVCTHSSGLINEVNFSDVYVTPDKKCYIWSGRTNCGLKIIAFDDFPEFLSQLESAYDGENRSYLLNYKGCNYRVERTIALEGVQYCARKMPTSVPNLKNLGIPIRICEHLLSLAGCSGLILLAGATGSGKSTTVSALLKEFLQRKGGYAFTIEDPIEMPLDGVYVTQNAELGLCKQTTPPDGKWEEGIKSALRSKPRYIYLGEIREPAVASEALRAATSGHLVLSTIHANNINDAVNALVKYAASSGISEEMAYELVANGFLGCIHQILEGVPKKAKVSYLFANPDMNAACQVRGMLRSGKLNLGTILEQQRIKMERGLALF
ncbi:MAG: ATPase, T2SS/T4P/T4SS family [Alphaproteobacteria bacterium]